MFKHRICASVFLLISSVMLAALLFSFYPKEAKPEKAKTCGPYVGYTHDSDSEKIDLYTNDGAYVTSVAAGSSAANAGIQEGDIITKLGDSSISSSSDLVLAVRSHSAGDNVQVTFNRTGQENTVSVTLGSDS